MRKIFFMFCTLLIVSMTGLLAFSSKDRLLSGFQEKSGISAEGKKDYAKAVECYKKALIHDSSKTGARLGLCRSYLAQNDYASAEQAYLDGIQAEPDNTEYYIGLSALYVKQREFSKASRLLNNIKSDYVRIKIGSMRPKTPEMLPVPGRYEKRIEVNLKSEKGSLYYTTGEADDTEAKAYTDVIELDTGKTVIKAFSVSGNGLISDIAEGEYDLDRIVERAYFTDSGIEAMAREALGKKDGTFMTDELWDIESLSNVSKDGEIICGAIGSFKDLKYFTGLKELKLKKLEGEIPLVTVPDGISLSSLTLSGCSLGNEIINRISSFSLIRELDLSDNKIESLEELSAFKNLEKLDISGNNISDLSELDDLKKLCYLDAAENAIQDVSTLSGLPELSYISISDNRISDLSTLLSLVKLSFLDVSKNKIPDLTELSKIKGLKGIRCEDNAIADLSPLSSLKDLESIDFKDNLITDISTLAVLNRLKSINLSGNSIANISPLSKNDGITELILSRNRIKDISSIASLTKLSLIDLQGNPVTDYSPLKKCQQLKTVFADTGAKQSDGTLVSGAVEGIPAD
ncbi:MAG: leucine-rich repeat domain-containing protein [Bacillota bacterium]|nr:leucine-rich repeat domain-containing protein [Bacillota bacterium]